ncbi:MAG TPA: murein transglycosylase A [Azoarcus taiwanensis]|uniref:peptidoglycan lytic exotransglycosylase n=1 Tax=Azoarcus taiwanensis TaxID=666964 RepID=A0A972FHH0_9RHOO|nr:murein transglycosylase A [Azoarcus taiwanensis]NMG04815.1 murein transglycosylase [Azoarcus taiwanensis]HRQ58329.1 murein transglycosylase A [Azoarcus taiwanensis]
MQAPKALYLALLALAIAGLSACASRTAPAPCPETTCPACPTCPTIAEPEPEREPAPPLQMASWADLAGWNHDDHAQAWPALRSSCSTLIRQSLWQSVCSAAESLGATPSTHAVRQFFEAHFTPWATVNPDGGRQGLVTGYYEPLIEGSRQPSTQYAWPIRGVPEDMLTIDLGDVYPDLRGMRLRGRLVENRIVPYWDRSQLTELGDLLPAPVLLWASDPIDLFFLQVQGSGQVRLPDGTRVRIGYADQNGHPYRSIGRWLIDQGELTLENASMQGIKAWAKSNPNRLKELLDTNPSYVFFRELPPSDGGPIGAQGHPLTAERSLAIDPRFTPLGAPVFLDTTFPLSDRPLRRLMVAQDTGGAIKGPVRADFFWGFGDDAGALAGRMRQQGRMWVLLPNGHTP